MRVKVNKDACIACGACAAIADEVFEIKDTDEGMFAEAIKGDVPKELEDDVQDAMDGCPTGAIVEDNE